MEARMAAKEISVKTYVVRLSSEERQHLETLVRKGKSPARRLLKARILLKADVSEAGEGWSDSRIIEALDASPSMVYRCASFFHHIYAFTHPLEFASRLSRSALACIRSAVPKPSVN